MTTIKKPAVGAIGFEIWIETFVDLAAATSITFKCRKPDDSVVSFTATALDKSAPRGNVRHGARYVTTSVGDLDQSGEWEIQVVAIMPGFNGPGLIAKMDVEEAL